MGETVPVGKLDFLTPIGAQDRLEFRKSDEVRGGTVDENTSTLILP